ncbi:diguanylate cyclase [Clostridium baratii]|uniref:Binding-protein-dependent transport system inner membrane protein n=1 Tax=Clostridium baratii TaxID=1561 RepID=A0A174Q2U8_9CLOT|nr:ABC transporter permease [Clostridium baratii]OPF51830.1 diguanylate cyclase [Clostridium baratii]OPF53476.1 diguanylate cyclase [Clostridium baratii]OPF57379.1 diguanylate cyclase [Clostridium baratii]OPF60523.1 diguanylate cyclase [Clostridium baratii]CUP66181.1 binding-protein-dependent transport system inner membrane protein [Clostridium baratii]
MENDMQLNKDLFTPLREDEKNFKEVLRPSVGYWKDAWRRLKSNKVALISLIIIILIAIFAIVTPWVSKYAYDQTDLTITNAKPSMEHWMGTDKLGRDLFVRLAYGARYSLIIGIAAAIINLVIGVVYGGIAGFFGGTIDNIMMRIVDVLYSIPSIIYVVLLMALFKEANIGGSGLMPIILALSISYWVGMARIVRGDILQLKQQEFVLAARTLGASKFRILFKHLIPNCVGSIIVTMTLLVPSAIFTEAFLSFLGLGINAPLASLGTLCNDAMSAIYLYPYQLFFPSLAICLIILSFNMLGDGLTEALDPKHQK